MTLRARIPVFTLLAVSASRLFAQTFGEITGTVLDSSNAVLPGAVVTVTNTATSQIRKVTANDSGNYTVPFLVPGVYDVQAESRGFRSSSRKGVELQVGATARIDFGLQVGDVTQEVIISGGVPLLDTENSTIGTVVETKRIVELPLNGRNYTQLIALSPNVSAEMQAGGKGPQRQGGERTSQTFSIAGQRLVFNHFTLDGAENTDVNFNTFIIRPSIDALQEFKVQTGVYSAEFGRQTAQINVTTKPGSNQFHGALFEFLRNNAIDAREWGQVGNKNPFRRNQFGFTLDGRIIPNKLFFMSNFEETQERKTLFGTANVPTVKMRNGDFSGQRSVYDPLTRVFGTDANGNLKALSAVPFPNNTIPQIRFNPIAVQLLEFYPLPNQNKGDNILSNYVRDRARPTDWEQFVQRIDWTQSANSTWFGRFSWGDEYLKNISSFATQEGYNTTKVYQGLLANTRVFGPSVVNEFRFAYNQFQNDQLPYYAYKRNVTGELGIIGSPSLPPVAWGAPFMQFQNGLTNFGQDGNGPFLNRNHTFQWIDNLSIVRGKHSFKIGGEIRRDRYNQYGNEHDRGSYQFQANATPDPANKAATGHSFADYLLGQVYFTAQTLGLADSLYRATSLSGYAEDTWKLTRRLTVNIGLRYEYVPPFVDKYRGMANLQMFGVTNRNQVPILTRPGSGDFYQGMSFHFDDSIPVQAGDRYLGRALVRDDKTNFAPRLGISYSPGAGWVIRTGFGMFYTQDSTNPEFDKARNVVGYRQFYSDDQKPNSSLSNPYANQPGRCSNWSGPCLFSPSILASFTDRKTPYSVQWMFNLQRQVTQNISIEADYLGNEGHHLQIQDTWNIAPTRTGPNDTSTIDQRKPWQQYAIIYGVNGNVSSNYHGASLKLQQRLHQGLTYMVGFTWSKAIDEGSGIRRNDGDGAGPNPYNRSADRGLAQYDQRRRLVASSLYELPFGKGKQFANGSSLLDKVIGGWQVGGILTFADGAPWGVGGIGDLNATSLNNVPNATGISPIPANRSASNFWNITAFDPFNPTLTYLYGNVGRNVLTAPGTRQWDVSVIKNTRIREGHELQIRAEAFNATNHPNWNSPAADARTPATFGKITMAKTMRDLQFGLKYVF